MKRICVFCGSSMGNQPIYQTEAQNLANYFLENNIDLIYGGSNVGIMKVLADRMLSQGGKAIGVMPQFLIDIQVGHDELSEMHIVENMQERKVLLAEISDGFIAFPGGIGTLDELFEMLTMTQLRVHDKPIGMLNVNGFFDDLIRFLDRAVDDGFIREEHRNNIVVSKDIPELIDKMNAFEPIKLTHWIKDIKEESST